MTMGSRCPSSLAYLLTLGKTRVDATPRIFTPDRGGRTARVRSRLRSRPSERMASRFSDSDILYTFALSADVPEDAWRTRLGWTTAFQGDKARSFINLYTAEQMAAACQSLFAGKQDVMLLAFIVDSMREEADLEIKFEAAEFEAGGVGAHAHCYGGYIPYACLQAPPALLQLNEDGRHIFPLMGAALAEANRLAREEERANDSDEATDDGLPPFNQHTFDEDD